MTEREKKANSSLHRNEFASSFWFTELCKKKGAKKLDPLVQSEDTVNGEPRCWDTVGLQDLGSECQSEHTVQYNDHSSVESKDCWVVCGGVWWRAGTR